MLDLEKMLDPDPYPDPHLINADPPPWIKVSTYGTGTYPFKTFRRPQPRYGIGVYNKSDKVGARPIYQMGTE